MRVRKANAAMKAHAKKLQPVAFTDWSTASADKIISDVRNAINHIWNSSKNKVSP